MGVEPMPLNPVGGIQLYNSTGCTVASLGKGMIGTKQDSGRVLAMQKPDDDVCDIAEELEATEE